MMAAHALNFLDLARLAMPLMTVAQRTEAEVLIAEIRTANAGDMLAEYVGRSADAFELGLQGIRSAVVAALHSGGVEALQGLRRILPGLLREANREPLLWEPLSEAMAHAFFTAFVGETGDTDELGLTRTGNAQVGAFAFSEEPVVTEAMKQWRSREVFETDLGSSELRGFAEEIRNRAIFSARTTNAEYLKEIAAQVDDLLAGKSNLSTARWRLMKKLKELGYDPTTGFPGDVGAVPPAERDSLQDLSSARRIDLVLETNVRMAQGYAQVLGGSTKTAVQSHPAWELARLYHRDVPRGSPESNSVGWQRRWTDAGESVAWDGAMKDRFVALKWSPIWDALGDGAGGYTDTLLNPFPPFAFRSGMAWRAVRREDSGGLGESGERRPETGKLTPSQEEVSRIVHDMPADLAAELRRELGL